MQTAGTAPQGSVWTSSLFCESSPGPCCSGCSAQTPRLPRPPRRAVGPASRLTACVRLKRAPHGEAPLGSCFCRGRFPGKACSWARGPGLCLLAAGRGWDASVVGVRPGPEDRGAECGAGGAAGRRGDRDPGAADCALAGVQAPWGVQAGRPASFHAPSSWRAARERPRPCGPRSRSCRPRRSPGDWCSGARGTT